jgi:cytochrome c peroxidase
MMRPRLRRVLLAGTWALLAGTLGAPFLKGESGGRAFDDDNPSADGSLGRRIFFQETFGGNGRTCGTCHQPENEFALSPDAVRAIHDRDPRDPLFRPIDSDDGSGRDYTSLLQHALVRVVVPLADNVSLVSDPAKRTIVVRRAVPSIVNVALTAPYQQDGRALTLQEQARAAVRNHLEPVRDPNPRELAALARFESEVFEPQRLKEARDVPSAVSPPRGFSMPVSSPAALQGRDVFRRSCERCHGGETASIAGSQGRPFSDVSVSEANRLQLPLLRLAFRGSDGSVTIVESPDPGRAAITGALGDLNAFDTPPLRGIKHTAPYFHDNSAATLKDVIDHYNQFLGTNISFRDRDALIAFLETL